MLFMRLACRALTMLTILLSRDGVQTRLDARHKIAIGDY